jgi:hypothetical protein
MSDKSEAFLLPAPPQPTVTSQAEWDGLPPEAKAMALFAWSEFWFRQTPAAGPTDRGARIVIPNPPTGEPPSTDGWKQSPSVQERESIRDQSWK